MHCQYCENELDDQVELKRNFIGQYFECLYCGKKYYVEVEEGIDGDNMVAKMEIDMFDMSDDNFDEDIEYIANNQDDFEILHYPKYMKYWYYTISGSRQSGFKTKFDGIVEAEGYLFPLKLVLSRFNNKETTYIIESAFEISEEDYNWFYSETSKFKGFKGGL